MIRKIGLAIALLTTAAALSACGEKPPQAAESAPVGTAMAADLRLLEEARQFGVDLHLVVVEARQRSAERDRDGRERAPSRESGGCGSARHSEGRHELVGRFGMGVGGHEVFKLAGRNDARVGELLDDGFKIGGHR